MHNSTSEPDRRAVLAGAAAIGAFGLGGILFSLTLPFLVAHFRERQLMLMGTAGAAIAFLLIALALRAGLAPVDLKLITAALLLLALVLPRLRARPA